MKKKILVIGITMNSAGTEKSFLSFANLLDYDKYDVDLLLAKKGGDFYELLPKNINVIEMERGGDMFTLTGKNANKVIFNTFVKKNPFTLFEIFPYFMSALFNRKNRSATVMKLWVKMMRKLPAFDNGIVYDEALAYWGDKAMFFMVDKVKAKKKIAWLHFDYANPPRDDGTYLPYFEKCDKIVTVSNVIDESLRAKLPSIAEKYVMMENINNPRFIWDMALRGDTFEDRHFTGQRILSIMRICEQKGYDFIVPALVQLKKDGYDLRWYIIGSGDEDTVAEMKEDAMRREVADMLIFLGTTTNPYSYLRDCDLFVLPSRHEGKPITVEEAKIMYKPIVVCNYLSANEQLADGKFGMICEIGAEPLYNAVKKMLDSKALRDRYALNLSEENFSNESEIDKFYEM
jgi:Glycosyltransferase